MAWGSRMPLTVTAALRGVAMSVGANIAASAAALGAPVSTGCSGSLFLTPTNRVTKQAPPP